MEHGCSACLERAGQVLMIAGPRNGTASPRCIGVGVMAFRATRRLGRNWQPARDDLPPCPESNSTYAQ